MRLTSLLYYGVRLVPMAFLMMTMVTTMTSLALIKVTLMTEMIALGAGVLAEIGSGRMILGLIQVLVIPGRLLLGSCWPHLAKHLVNNFMPMVLRSLMLLQVLGSIPYAIHGLAIFRWCRSSPSIRTLWSFVPLVFALAMLMVALKLPSDEFLSALELQTDFLSQLLVTIQMQDGFMCQFVVQSMMLGTRTTWWMT